MLKKAKRKGTAVPEWIVVLGLIVLLAAPIAYAILNNSNAEGDSAATAVDSLDVPSTIP